MMAEVVAIILETIMMWPTVQPYLAQKIRMHYIYEHVKDAFLVHINMH
jgi:hypothetical protein